MVTPSPSTVSRVLNGSKRVADDKRALVMAAVAAQNYRPNFVARGLARGRSMTIGVVVQDIASPFFSGMLAGIEQALDQSGYSPMFVSTRWREQGANEDEQSIQLLLDRRVDGLIVLAGQASDDYLRSVAEQVPTVIAARHVPGLEQQEITIDNIEGALFAVRYLIGLGHTRIAHITGHNNHPDTNDRLLGYQRALADAAIPFDETLVVEGAFNEASGQQGVEQLLARGARFTAVFTANDQMAYGAMLALSAHNFLIPEDVSVVGFDDLSLSAYTLPPLTTVRQPAQEMGRAAADAIVHILDDIPPTLPSLRAEVVIRKSAVRCRN